MLSQLHAMFLKSEAALFIIFARFGKSMYAKNVPSEIKIQFLMDYQDVCLRVDCL